MKLRCCSSYTAPAYIWAALSIIAAILCPFGLYFSNWLEKSAGDGRWDSVSSFRVCRNESSMISTACSSYLSFGQIYSAEWKAVTLLMGLGACLLVLVALTAIFGFCVTKLFNKVVVVLTFSFQLLGGEYSEPGTWLNSGADAAGYMQLSIVTLRVCGRWVPRPCNVFKPHYLFSVSLLPPS